MAVMRDENNKMFPIAWQWLKRKQMITGSGVIKR